jgi:hypothetical protein
MKLQPINIIVGTRLIAKSNGSVWVVVNKISHRSKYKFNIRLASSKDSKIHEDLDMDLIIDKFDWYF